MTENPGEIDWGTVLRTSPLTGISSEDISWDAVNDTVEDEKDFTAFIATQIRFIETSNLSLYGMMQTYMGRRNVEDRKMVLRLSAYNTNRAEIWSEYLRRKDRETSVLPEIQQFYDSLSMEDDPLHMLILIETLNLAGIAFYKSMQETGDSAFHQITTLAETQKREEYGLIMPWLQDKLSEKTEEERHTIISQLEPYIDMIEDMYAGTYDHTGSFDRTEARTEVKQLVKQVYRSLGLIR